MSKDAELGKKQNKAPALWMSSRLGFFITCLFASFNFMIQRLNINFAVVCMVKLPPLGGMNFSSMHVINNSANYDYDDISTYSILKASEFQEVNNNEPDYMFSNCQPPAVASHDNISSLIYDQGEYFYWDKATQGQILGSFFYGYFLSQILGGWISDRFGGKKAFIGSVFALSFLTVLNPIAARLGPEYLFIIRMIQGISQGASAPLLNVLSARWSAVSERSFLLSLATFGFVIAAFVSNPLCAFICQTFNWTYIFYVTGGIGLIWCVVAYFFVYSWPENHPRINNQELEYLQKNRSVQPGGKGPSKIKMIVPWRSIIFSAPVNVIHITHFCTLWGFAVISMYLPTFMKEVLHMDVRKNGILSSLPFLGMLILHMGVGRAFDTLRKKKFCSVTKLRKAFNTTGLLPVVISLSMMGLIPCDDNTFAIILISIAQSMGQVAFMGGYFFSIFDIAPRYAGTITGLTNTYGVLTGFICPALIGYLTPNGSRQEWLTVFWISSAITAFGTIVYLIFGSSKLQPWAKVPERRQSKLTEMKHLQQQLIIPTSITETEKKPGEYY